MIMLTLMTSQQFYLGLQLVEVIPLMSNAAIVLMTRKW